MTATIIEVAMLPKQIELMEDRTHFEVLMCGAFRSGKTRVGCFKAVDMASAPGAFIGLCRKTFTSLKTSTLRTLLQPDGPLPPVLPAGSYTHNKSDHIIKLRGGGEIYYFGFDHPERLGSLGFDAVVVDEGIELDADEYTMLVGRCSGQAGRYRQIVTVTNPGAPSHFLHKRFYDEHDASRRVIESNALENIFLPRDYVAQLEKLKGTDYERYVLGKWAAYEGLVYSVFRRDAHVLHRRGPWKRVVLGIDEGYTNPAVCLVCGIDGDGRKHIITEFYKAQVLPAEFVAKVAGLASRSDTEVAFVDPSAAGLIADLRKAGVKTRKANNAVLDGIRVVQTELTVAGDGRPRLTVEPGCTETIRELEGYCWRKGKDEPVKDGDHAMDALRYLCMGVQSKRRLRFGPVGAVVKEIHREQGIPSEAEKVAARAAEPGPHSHAVPLVDDALEERLATADVAAARERILDDDSAWQ